MHGNDIADMTEILIHPAAEKSSSTRPQEALLSDMDLPIRKRFFPLGFAVDILTNRHELLEAADASFGHSALRHGSAQIQIRFGVSEGKNRQLAPSPIRREYNHLYLMVADAENQAVLDLRTRENFVWLNEATVKNALYLRHNFLEKVVYLLLGASVVTDIHAGCVSKHGKGILLCGDSGAGKSTLSYGCARAGWTYTSDDTCYLINATEEPRVIGHSHRIRFRPAAKALFPELHEREISPRMEGKPSIEVLVSELPVLSTANEANVHAVIYLRRSPSIRPALTQLPAGSAARKISEELYSTGEIRAMHEGTLQKLARTPAFELHYDNLEEAISQLDLLVATL